MEPGTEPEGAWVFLSHSNKDFEKVREIRNELERRGHKPLMFFLKCLECDDARLPDLLKEEIAARQWFILCDSPSAQASKWVQEEKAMIQAMPGKTVRTVDLSKGLETEIHKIVELSKRATVFLSYARQDQEIAERVRAALLRHDYRVWLDAASIIPGDDWASVIQSAIDDAIARGFVLVLLSPACLKSQWTKHEIDYALSRQSNVIPVVVAPFADEDLPQHLAYQLGHLQWFDLTTGPFDEKVEELIRGLRTREVE